MASDLATRIARAGLRVEGDVITVELAAGRKHRVRFRETPDAIELRAMVARAAAITDLDRATILAWEKNRSTHLVGFHVDARSRLVGRCHVPRAGLTESEILRAVRHLAAECDRFEYLLTGRDVE